MDLSSRKKKGVYSPREDSFLLAKVVKKHSGKGKRVLDLGTGSGIQGIVAASNGSEVVSSDVSETALKLAEENAGDLQTSFVQSDLFSEISSEFDLIFFNPPYLPGKEGHQDLDGGKKGRELLDRFLNHFRDYLADGGKAFFVQSSLNDFRKTEEILKQKGMNFRIEEEKKIPWEKLRVCGASENGR